MIGEPGAWRAGLEEAGIEIVAEPPCDLAVAAPAAVDEAIASGAGALIVDGPAGRRELARAG